MYEVVSSSQWDTKCLVELWICQFSSKKGTGANVRMLGLVLSLLRERVAHYENHRQIPE